MKKDYCTCTNYECKMHPLKHDKGCTPCVIANLKTKDLPKCFFNLVNGADTRNGDTFIDFAKAVIESENQIDR